MSEVKIHLLMYPNIMTRVEDHSVEINITGFYEENGRIYILGVMAIDGRYISFKLDMTPAIKRLIEEQIDSIQLKVVKEDA